MEIIARGLTRQGWIEVQRIQAPPDASPALYAQRLVNFVHAQGFFGASVEVVGLPLNRGPEAAR